MSDVIMWEDLAKLEPKPVPFFIDPYIPQESISFLYGDTSIGKSPLTWAMAKAIGMGTHFYGLPCKKGRVLYIDVDTPEVAVVPRIKEEKDPAPGVGFLFTTPIHCPNPSTEKLEELVKAREAIEPDVVFINTLIKAHDLDDKDSKSPSIVYSFFQEFFRGSSLVFTHHIRKSPIDPKIKEDARESFSGSKHWLDDAQVGLHLAKWGKKGGDGWQGLRLSHTKSQVSECVGPMQLELHPNGTTIRSPEFDQLLFVYEKMNEFPELPRGKLDEAIAKELGVSTKTISRRRDEIECGRFPGSRRFLGGDSDIPTLDVVGNPGSKRG